MKLKKLTLDIISFTLETYYILAIGYVVGSIVAAVINHYNNV